MNGAYQSPGGDLGKLLEQNGWLKSEIERLRDSQLTELDLVRFEQRINERSAKRDAEIMAKWHDSLDSWWKHKPVEIRQIFDERAQHRENEKEAERKRVFRRLVAENRITAMLVAGGIALANPSFVAVLGNAFKLVRTTLGF